MLLNTLKIIPQTVVVSLDTMGSLGASTNRQTSSVCVITALLQRLYNTSNTKQEELPSSAGMLVCSLKNEFLSEIHRDNESGFNINVCQYV